MSISSMPLNQAREALVSAAQTKIVLLGQVRDQGRKIFDLEQEVQRLATTLSQTQQALSDSRREVEALRAQLPDAATQNAFNSLVEYLTNPGEMCPELRIAA